MLPCSVAEKLWTRSPISSAQERTYEQRKRDEESNELQAFQARGERGCGNFFARRESARAWPLACSCATPSSPLTRTSALTDQSFTSHLFPSKQLMRENLVVQEASVRSVPRHLRGINRSSLVLQQQIIDAHNNRSSLAAPDARFRRTPRLRRGRSQPSRRGLSSQQRRSPLQPL